MLATLTDAPFDGPAWVFEDKFDGFRMVAVIKDGSVTLYSRNGKIISHSYAEVARALARFKVDAILDSELVALDAHGVSRFQLLQNALSPGLFTSGPRRQRRKTPYPAPARMRCDAGGRRRATAELLQGALVRWSPCVWRTRSRHARRLACA